jgi:sequestosome 1
MRRAWRRWWRTTYAEPWKKCKKEKKEEKKREKKERKEKKKAEKMAEGGAAKAENESSSSSSSDEGEASPNGDYLKSVGESVAAMLDPLGIDVEVDVEHRGQRRRCHRGGHHRGGPWGFGMHGHFGGPSWGFRGGRGGHCPWRTTPSTASEPMPQPQQTNPTGPSQAPQEKGHDVDTNLETGEIASGVQTPMSSGNFTKANDMFEGNGWTFVPPPANLEEEVEGATRGVEQLNVSAEAPPQYVPVSGDYPNADPLVQAAVADMQRMGFSDDGGWLTALLTAYGGDIGRALDAINAKK